MYEYKDLENSVGKPVARIEGGGGAGPTKSGPFGPKKWTFLNITSLPSYKNPIFGPLCG